MAMNPLPPQAYTKETLLKAYQWLMVQNSSIKEMATTPDILVSLYLKANRDGDSALERPSILNFKSELKSLAGMMGELERPQPKVERVETTTVAPATIAPTTLAPNPDILGLLDLSSKGMIHEVKEEFNLSSDLEALRMLVKIGYSRSKALLR